MAQVNRLTIGFADEEMAEIRAAEADVQILTEEYARSGAREPLDPRSFSAVVRALTRIGLAEIRRARLARHYETIAPYMNSVFTDEKLEAMVEAARASEQIYADT